MNSVTEEESDLDVVIQTHQYSTIWFWLMVVDPDLYLINDPVPDPDPYPIYQRFKGI